MAFTREFIRSAAKESGTEIPKELEDALVQEHITARDAYAGEKVSKALEENQPDPAPKVKDTEEYKALKREFDEYKQGQETKELRASKETAFRALLKDGGISETGWSRIIKAHSAEIEALELDEAGKAKNGDATIKAVKAEWPEFVTTMTVTGTGAANPPANSGGKTKSTEEIYKKDDRGRYIMTAAERQAAIAESMAQGGE